MPRCFPKIALLLFWPALAHTLGGERQVYFNDFNGPEGSSFPEWTSSPITFVSEKTPPGSGSLPAPQVTTTKSPNGAQKFLGEFGGPPIGKPSDPGYNHTRVDQTISLTLTHLPAHTSLTITFDLYVLKSWDGNSPAFGRDRFLFGIAGAPPLLDTTFSNNPKTKTDGSFQDFPAPNSPPWSGASTTGTLGYSGFFRDAIYHFQFHIPHIASDVTFRFTSSLFEGKGTADESWGLDNVSVVATTDLR